VDGGESLQKNTIFPMLQPSRSIDVLLVNNNSANTTNKFPNGSEILRTYQQSFSQNLERMPFIPSVSTFVSQGPNKRATFFGCNDQSKITIVYLPNVGYVYENNQPTSKLLYSKGETRAMISNGMSIAGQGRDPGWPTCLGCAVMMKAGGNLPGEWPD
jgi:lysophospholipase